MSPSPILAEPRGALATLRELEFTQLLKVIARRWKWMALGIVAGLVICVLYFLYAPKKYESVASIFVMQKDMSLPTAAGPQSGSGDRAVSEDLLATHMQLIQSNRIIRDALNTGDLVAAESIQNKVDLETTAEDYVIENLTVTRGGAGQSKNAHILTLAFRHDSAEDAQRIVVSIVDSYQSFLETTFKDVNSEAAGLIRQAEEELGAELKKAESAYASFREQTPLLWKGEVGTNVHRDRFEQVQADLNQIQLEITTAQSRLETVDNALKLFDELNVPDIERLSVIDDANAARISMLISVDQPATIDAAFQAAQPERAESARSEFSALLSLMTKEQSARLSMGPNHPDVRALKAEIDALKQFLAEKSKTLAPAEHRFSRDPKAIVSSYVSFLRNDLMALTLRQKELEKVAQESELKAKELVKYELEGETRQKDVKRCQELYEAVVDRLREINLAGDYGGFINEIIVDPRVGELVWPKLSICLALGVILGCALGAFGVVTAEMRDQSFRDPADIKAAFDSPIISHIPFMQVRPASQQSKSPISPAVAVFHRPKSRESEVFRGLRTQLLFNLREANGKVIQFTSPKQGDGKSTVVANLAVSLARAGQKILLIDGDLRRPIIHRLFDVPMDKGLSSLLQGKEKLKDVIRSCGIPNLSLLPCGPIPSNPTELLAQPSLSQVLQVVKQHFDLVLIDSPPVLPVADPCVITSHVDGVVMIIRVGRDSKPEALRASELLTDVGSRFLGIVVNGGDTRGVGYEYGVYGKSYQAYESLPEQAVAPGSRSNGAQAL
jgi:capsular exopolysaccharide synthesis family protein